MKSGRKQEKANIAIEPEKPTIPNLESINMLINPNDMIAKNIDMVHVTYSSEGLVLSLSQKQYSAETPTPHVLLARYSMSWVHFAKTARLFSQILADNREMAKESLIKELFPEENFQETK